MGKPALRCAIIVRIHTAAAFDKRSAGAAPWPPGGHPSKFAVTQRRHGRRLIRVRTAEPGVPGRHGDRARAFDLRCPPDPGRESQDVSTGPGRFLCASTRVKPPSIPISERNSDSRNRIIGAATNEPIPVRHLSRRRARRRHRTVSSKDGVTRQPAAGPRARLRRRQHRGSPKFDERLADRTPRRRGDSARSGASCERKPCDSSPSGLRTANCLFRSICSALISSEAASVFTGIVDSSVPPRPERPLPRKRRNIALDGRRVAMDTGANCGTLHRFHRRAIWPGGGAPRIRRRH